MNLLNKENQILLKEMVKLTLNYVTKVHLLGIYGQF